MKRLFLVIYLIGSITFGITVEEIMDNVDEYRHLKSAKVESKMIIQQGRRKMTKEMKSLIKGSELGLTEFTNPRDRGSKFLKRGEDLWMFFPDAEDIVKISGHMLEQGMMGSDFSYKDMMESNKLTDLYNFELKKEEKYKERMCYVIEGIKKDDSDASYYRRVSWVDKDRSVLLKEELYAQSGKLLKVMDIKKVENIEGRWFGTHTIIDNKLKKNTNTEYILESVKFNVDIPDSTFSLRNLKR
ncbi:MAG: outer membrane lipoprotein-sorting protein [Fusobacteriota bacterium]